jgi:hypothetical protein
MSLARSLCMFFAVNPHEELTTNDICQKWNKQPEGNTYTVLRNLVKDGYLLWRIKAGDQVRTYRAGPAIEASLRGGV